jgi:mRNA interferase MazF
MMTESIQQGELYWLDPVTVATLGSSQRHPYVVIQDDVLNHSRISTTVVCGVTTNLHRAAEPGNVLLNPNEGGLPKQSVVVVSQVMSLDKTHLQNKIGILSRERVHQILDGLRFQQRAFFP